MDCLLTCLCTKSPQITSGDLPILLFASFSLLYNSGLVYSTGVASLEGWKEIKEAA
jgi:hypothetical protein